MTKNTGKLVSHWSKRNIGAATGIIVFATIIVCGFGVYTVRLVHTNSVLASATAHTDPRFTLLSAGTIMTNEVPATLLACGVTVNDEFVLHRPTGLQASRARITAKQAVTIGRTYADAQLFAATTLFASVTDIDSVPPPGTTEHANVVQNVSAWIVTFTTTHPQNVINAKEPAPGQTPASFTPKHFNIVLNSETGAFVVGFFTL